MKMKPKQKMIEVAPGKWMPMNGKPPEVTLAQWAEDPSGHWTLKPYEDHLIRLDDNVLRVLGLSRSQYKTLRRLAEVGFIEGGCVAPHSFLINIQSWANHLKRVIEDPYFWEQGRGNIEAYRGARDNGRYAHSKAKGA